MNYRFNIPMIKNIGLLEHVNAFYILQCNSIWKYYFNKGETIVGFAHRIAQIRCVEKFSYHKLQWNVVKTLKC